MDTRKRRKEVSGNRSFSLDLVHSLPKRPRVQAQRKFAQGAPVLPMSHVVDVSASDNSSIVSSCKSSIDKSSKDSFFGQKANDFTISPADGMESVEDLVLPVRPKTEDFLTFLCFRGTPLLPPSLDHFNTPPKPFKQSHQKPLKENDRPNIKSRLSTDDSNSLLSKESKAKQSDVVVEVRPNKTCVTSSPGLKSLKEKHSSRLLNARKKLLKRALELKSKSIRASRHCSKRLTRSSNVRRISPEKKISNSLERRERAERRQQLLDSQEQDDKKQPSDKTVTRSKSFDYQKHREIPTLVRSRSTCQDSDKPNSLRIYRTQLSPATLAARKKAKFAIRAKPKVSRILMRLGAKSQSPNSASRERATRSSTDQTDANLSSESKKRSSSSEVKMEVKQEESEEERRRSTRALRMVRKEENVTFYARRSGRLPSHNSNADGDDVKPDVSQLSVTIPTPRARCNSGASNSSPYVSSCSSPSLSPKTNFSKRLQRATNEVPYRNTRQSHPGVKSDVTVRCVTPSREVMRCVRSAPPSRQSSPNFIPTIARRTRQSVDQISGSNSGLAVTKTRSSSTIECSSKESFHRKHLNESSRSDTSDDSESLKAPKKQRNKRLTKRSERIGQTERHSGTRQLISDSHSSDTESEGPLQISTGGNISLLNSSIKTEIFSSDDEIEDSLITRRKCIPVSIKNEDTSDQATAVENTLSTVFKDDSSILQVVSNPVVSTCEIVDSKIQSKPTSISVLKKKVSSTRRRTSANPQENRLNEVLGSVAKDFGENIDESHYDKLETDLATGNKSPEKRMRRNSDKGADAKSTIKKNAGGKKLSEVVKNLTRKKISGETFDDQPLFLRGLKNIATATVADCKKQRQVGEVCDPRVNVSISTTVSLCTQLTTTTTYDTISTTTTSLSSTLCAKISKLSPPKGVSKNSRLIERKLPYAPIAASEQDNVKKPRSAPLFIPSIYDKSKNQNTDVVDSSKVSSSELKRNPKDSYMNDQEDISSTDASNHEDETTEKPSKESIDISKSGVALSSSIFYGSGACKSSTANKSKFRATEIKIPLLPKSSLSITKVSKSSKSEASSSNISVTHLNIPKVSKYSSSSSVVTLTSTVTATYLNSRPANFGPSGPIACASVKSVSVDKTSKNKIEVAKSSRSSVGEPLIIPSVSSYVSRPLNQINNIPTVQNMNEQNTIQLDPVQQSIESVVEGPNSVTNGSSFTNSGVLLPYTHQAVSSLPLVNTSLNCPQIAPLPTIMTPLPANVASLPLQQTYQQSSVTSINNSLLPMITSSDNVLSNVTPISSLIPFANPTCNMIPTIDNNNMMCTSSLVQATSSITPPIIYNTIQSYNSNTSLSSTHATSSGAPVAYFNSSVPYVAPTVVPQQGLTSVNTFLPQAPYTFVTLASQAVPSSMSSINISHQQSFSNELCPIIPIGGLNSNTPVTFQASPFPGQYVNNQSPANNQTRPILLPNAMIMTPQQNSAPSSPAKVKQINIAPKPNKLQNPPITVGSNANKAPSKPIQIAPKISTTNIAPTPALNKLPQFISTPHGSHIIQTIPTIPTLQSLPQNLQSLQATLGSQFAFNQGVTAINNPIMTADFSNQAINNAVARLPISANHHALVGAPLPVEQTINSFSQIHTLNNDISSQSETHEISLNNTVSVTPAVSFNDQNLINQTSIATISSSIMNSIDIQAISSVDNNGSENSISQSGKSISPQITLTSNIRGELPLNLDILNESSDLDMGNEDYELTVDDTVIESCDEDLDDDDESEPSSPPIPLLNSAELISKSSLPLSSKSVPDTIKESYVPNNVTNDSTTSICTLSNTQLISNTVNVTSCSMQLSTSVSSTNQSYNSSVVTPSRSKHLEVFPAPMPRITRNAVPRPQPSHIIQKSNANMSIASIKHASPVNYSNNKTLLLPVNRIESPVTATTESKDVGSVSTFDKLISNTVALSTTTIKSGSVPLNSSVTVSKSPISIDTTKTKQSSCKVSSYKDSAPSFVSTENTDVSGCQTKPNVTSTKTSKLSEAAVTSSISSTSETTLHSTASKSESNSSIFKPSVSTTLAVNSTNTSRSTPSSKSIESNVVKISVYTENNKSITISSASKTKQGNNLSLPVVKIINPGTVVSSSHASKGVSNLSNTANKSANAVTKNIGSNETSVKPSKGNNNTIHTSKPSISHVKNSSATSLATNHDLTKSLGNLAHKSNITVNKSNLLDLSKYTNPDTVSISRENLSAHNKKVKPMQSESLALKRSSSCSEKDFIVSKSSDSSQKSPGQNQTNATFSRRPSTSQSNRKLSNSNLQNEKAFKPQFASSSVTLQPVSKMKNQTPTPLENQSKKEPVLKRSLFKTKSQEDIRSKNAFSVVNESSVYAFEPDIDSKVEENSRFSKRIKTTPTVNQNSSRCAKQISNDITIKSSIMKGNVSNTSNVSVTSVSKPQEVKLVNNSKPEMVKSPTHVSSEQPKRNSRTEPEMLKSSAHVSSEQPKRNSRTEPEMLKSSAHVSSEQPKRNSRTEPEMLKSPTHVSSEQPKRNSRTEPEMVKSPTHVSSEQPKRNSRTEINQKLRNSRASLHTLAALDQSSSESNSTSKSNSIQCSPITSPAKNDAVTSIPVTKSNSSFGERMQTIEKTPKPVNNEHLINNSSLQSPGKVAEKLVSKPTAKNLDNAVSTEVSKSSKATTSEPKKGVEIAIQCDMDDPMTSFFRSGESGSQTEGPSRLPLPPSASPFYYLPLAMAALGEKLPAQLVQQMLAKTQGLVGAAEAGMILQQAAQLAQEHQAKVQQQGIPDAPLPEPPPVTKPVQSLSTSQQVNNKLTPEEAILVQTTPISADQQNQKAKQSKSKTVQRISHVPVVVAPTHLSTKSAAQAKSLEGSVKMTNASLATFTHPVDKPNVKPSPPVYITPPTNRINPQIYAPKVSSSVSVKKSTTNTQTSVDKPRNNISESFVQELSNKLLAVHNQNQNNERIKQSRSHSLDKESSNKKLKTDHLQEEREKRDTEHKAIANNNKRNNIVERGEENDKRVVDAEEKRSSSKSLKSNEILSKNVDGKQNNAKNKHKADSSSKANPAKKFKSKDTEKIEAADEDRGGSVRRSSRSSTSAATRATESDQHGAELMKRHRRAKKAAAALAFTDSDCMSPSSDSLPPPLSPQMSPDTLRGWPPPRLTSPSPSQSSTSSSTSQRSLRNHKSRNSSSTMNTTIQSPKTGGKRLQRSSSVGGCSSNSSTVTSIGTSGGSWHPDPLIAEAAPPRVSENALLTRAPSFFPSIEEFTDPLDYIEKIRPEAERFGICRIVPPASFRPECRVNDDMRFTVHNQYIHKLMNRWGPNVRTTQAIKRCLSRQNIEMKNNPLLGGLEVDLVQLYRAVETLGGLMTVLEQQLWGRVAQLCRIPKTAHDRLSKLDSIYCKYLLPYATLTPKEREMLLSEADHIHARVTTAVDSAIKEKRSMSDREESDEEGEESEREEESDCLECFTVGKAVSLSAFYRLARNTTAQWLPDPNGLEVDERYWSLVMEGNRHVCVHEASIDTTEHGYGFPSPKNGNAAKHQWNLKNLCQSNSSVLRSMGNVIGVTSPTLHVGMLFSSVCWYRDPHSLPWIEYIHSGASKIWYGVGSSHEVQLREAMKKLVPEYVKDSPVWLPADSIMVDPNALAECDVPVCRVVQEPGQFVIVFPGAFTSSLCTGYLIAESVFFAKHQYFERAKQSFDLLSKCGEPAMFSYERLVVSVSCDARATLETLVKVRPYFKDILSDNKKWREELRVKGVVKEGRIPLEESKSKRKGSGVSYEQNDESLCEVCKQEQYLAMVLTDGKGEVYCLQHAALNVKTEKLEKAKILYRHTAAELDSILKTLDERIHLKTTKKALSAASK